jgi:protein phosphatase 2C family protein 2/3
VCRTFGDVEAKATWKGGNPGVVVAEAEIHSFTINKNHDFIILGCDGIFDKLSNEDVVHCAWASTQGEGKDRATNVHQ